MSKSWEITLFIITVGQVTLVESKKIKIIG